MSINKKKLPERSSAKEKLYITPKDVFNAFDRGGSGEIGFLEYTDPWKLLHDAEIKEAFDSVDIGESGLVEWPEVVRSHDG